MSVVKMQMNSKVQMPILINDHQVRPDIDRIAHF